MSTKQTTSLSISGMPPFERRGMQPLQRAIRLTLAPAGLLFSLHAGVALANPEGGQVVGGEGAISRADANTTLVVQNSQNLAIDWETFNVQAHELVQFNQPGATATALNRIFDQNPSQIFGAIRANGQVFLMNPNGVFFSPTARVNVAGLVAAAAHIDANDFMAGKYNLDASLGEGVVVNQGLIEAATGGSVTLAGKVVKNEGVILASAGKVNLVAGNKMTLDFDGDGLIQFSIDEAVLQNPNGADAAVSNSGQIEADGGQVVLSAAAAQDVFSKVVNNEGVIKAGRIENQGGMVKLVGLGPSASVLNTGTIDVSAVTPLDKGGPGGISDGGSVEITGTHITQAGVIKADSATGNGGTIQLAATDTTLLTGNSVTSARGGTASAPSPASAGEGQGEGKGGTVQVLGNKVGLFDNATVDVSGSTGGGTALIGGDYQGKNPNVQNAARTYVGQDATIKADATVSGDGGKVIVWSDEVTRYYGSISAKGGPQGGDGGFAEVSGKQHLHFDGIANLLAPAGAIGTLLLDPKNILIDDSGSATLLTAADQFSDTPAADVTIDVDTLNAAAANVVLQANNDITVANMDATTKDVNITTAGISLTMQAGRSILINDNITTNNAAITLTANETVANGVSDANRDIGNAVITMADGKTINAGNGNVTLTVSTGPTTNNASGDITISNITTTGHVLVKNDGATAGSDILRTATSAITASSVALDISNAANTTGTIGTSLNKVNTTVANLELRTQGGSAFINETDGLDIGTATLGGLTGVNTGSGNFSLTAGGAVTDSETLTAAGFAITAAGATLDLANNVTTLAASMTGAGNGFTFTGEANGFTVGTVEGVSGITTAASSASGTASGGITLSVAAGSITINQNLTTGNASVADAAGDQSAVSGSISVTAVTGITGSGRVITGLAELTGADAGATTNDTVTSGGITLNVTGAGDVGLSAVDALTIGAATGNAATALNATAGNITVTSADRVNNGTPGSAIDVSFGAATGGSANTAGTLAVTTDGGAGVLGEIRVTSAEALKVGALVTAGASAQNVSIATTGGAALTVTNAAETLTGDTVTFDAGTGTLTVADTSLDVAAGSLTLRGDEIDLTGGANSVKGTGGTVTLEAGQALTTVGINDAASTLDLSTTDVAALQDGFTSITIGRADGTGLVTVGAVTFNDPVTIRAGGATGDITVSGAVATTGNTGVTLSAGSDITLNSTITTGNVSVVGSAGNDTATTGSISLTATSGTITGNASGRLITGNADVTLSGAGTDTATSGGITLSAGGAIQLAAADALTIGTATIAGDVTATSTATTGNISITSADKLSSDGTNGKVDVKFGAATGGDTNTAGTFSATTDGGAGDAGGIFVTAGEAFSLGALVTAGASGQNVSIATTGGAALTITNAAETLTGDTVTFDAGTGTLTVADTSLDVAAGSLTLRGDEIDLTGGANSVKGTGGTVTLEAGAAATTVGVGGGAGTLDVSDIDIAALQDGFTSITIGRADGTGLVTVDAVTFNDPVTIRAGGATGDITVSAAVATTGNTGVTLSAGSDITLNSTITTGNVTTTGTAGVDTATTGSISLTATSGTITGNASGRLITGNATVDATLTGGNDTATSGGITLSAGGAIQLASVDALTIGGATMNDGAGATTATTGNISVTTADKITSDGTLGKVDVKFGTASGADTNTAGTFSATTDGGAGDAGAVFVTAGEALRLGAVTTSGGNVTITSGGTNTALTATGNITTSNGNIDLRATGDLTVGTGAAITLNSGTGTLGLIADDPSPDDIGQIVIGDNVTITTANTTVAAMSFFGADLDISTTGTNITATGAGGTIAFRSTSGTVAMTFGAAAAGYDVTDLELARITQTDNIQFGEAAGLPKQTADITINTVDTTGMTTSGGGDPNVKVRQDPASAGKVVLHDGGGGTALKTGLGGVDIDAGTGGITAASATNSFAEIDAGGTVTLKVTTTGAIGSGTNRIQFAAAQDDVNVTSAPGGVFFDGLGALTLNNVSTAGALNVTAAGALADTGTLTVTGAATFQTTDAAITLDTTANTFGAVTLTVVDGGDVGTTRDGNLTLVENAATDLAGVTTDGTLSVTSTGAITDSGTLTVTGAASFITKAAATVGTITLDDNGDATLTNSLGSVTLRTLDAAGTATVASNITFKEGAAIDLALVDTGATLNLEAGNSVTQSGVVTANTLTATLTGATSALNLGTQTNNITNLGAITAPGGLTLTNGNNSVTVTGAVSATNTAVSIDVGTGTYSQNDVDISAGSGAITVTANQVAITNNTLDNAFQTTGTLTLKPGQTTTTMSLGGTTGTFALSATEVIDLAGGVTGAGNIVIGRSDHNAALTVDASVDFGAKTVKLQAGSFADTAGTDTISATTLDLDARNGAIGTSANPIETTVATLDASTAGASAGGIFIMETDALTLGNTRAVTTGAANQSIDVNAGGVLTVNHFVTTTGTGNITLTAGAIATIRGTANVGITVNTANVNGLNNQDISAVDGTITFSIAGNNRKILLQDETGPDRRSRIVVSGTGSIAIGNDNFVIETNDTTNAAQKITGSQTFTPAAGNKVAIGDTAIANFLALTGFAADLDITDADLNSASNIVIDGLTNVSGLMLLDMAAVFGGTGLTVKSGSTIDGTNVAGDSFEGSAITLRSGGAIGATNALVLDANSITVEATGGNAVTFTDTNTSDTTYNLGSVSALGPVSITRGVAATGNILVTLINSTGTVSVSNAAGAIRDKDDNSSDDDIIGTAVTLTALNDIGGNATDVTDTLKALEVKSTSLDASTTGTLGTHQIVLREADGTNLLDLDTAEDDITVVSTTGNLVVTDVQAGTTTPGAVSLTASAGNIDGVAAAGTNVAATTLTLTGSSGIGATNALETAASTLNFTNTTNAVQVTNTKATGLTVSGTNAGIGAVNLTETSGNLTVGNSDIVTAGGAVNLMASAVDADIIFGATALIDTTNGGVTAGGATVTLTADNIDLSAAASPAVNAGTGGDVTLKPNANGVAIQVGATAADGAATLGLTDAELNKIDIDAGHTLTIGSTTNTGGITVVGAANLTTASMAADVLLRSNSGNIAVNAALTVPANVTLNTTSGNISFGASGAITATGDTATLTAAGGNIEGNAAALTNVTATTLTASAATGIGATNALETDITNLTAHVTGIGNLVVTETSGVTLTDVDTANGAITITAGGAITVTDVASTTDADANDISITASSGNVTVTTVNAGTTAGDVTIQATAGSILDDANNATKIVGDRVTLTAANGVGESAGNGAVDTTANSLDISVTAAGLINLSETDGVNLFDLDTFNGSITVVAGGAVTATDVASLTDAEANDIDITGVGISVSLINAGTTAGDVFLDAGTGAITEGDGADGADIVAQDLELVATTGIADGARLEINATNLAAVTDSGDIIIQDTTGGLTIATVGVTTGVRITDTANNNSGADIIEITAASPLTVNQAVVNDDGGSITLAAQGAAVTDDLTIAANVTATGGTGAINLHAGDSILHNSGTVSAASTGAILYSAGTNFNDGVPVNGTNAGAITMASGAVAQSQDGNITLRAPGDVAVTVLNANSNADGTAGAVSVTADFDGVGGGLADSAGAITDAGGTDPNITASTLTLSAKTGIGAADELETQVSTLSLSNTVSGNAQIANSGGAINLTSVNQSGGNLTLTNTGGAITDSGTLTVTGAASFVTKAAAGVGTITLDDNGDATLTNSLGSVTLRTLNAAGSATVASAIVFKEGAATDLALVDTGSTLTVESTGAITDSGTLTATGAASFTTTDADITLDDNGDATLSNSLGSVTLTVNDGADLNATRDGNVTLKEGAATDLAAVTTDGTLAVESTGAITDSGTLMVTGTASFITKNNTGGTGTITLDDNGDATLSNSLGSVTLRTLDAAGTATVASAIVFKEGAATDLALVDTGSTLTVESTGAITDSGTLTVTGAASFTTTDADITLDTAANTFGAVTLTVVDGGDVGTTRDGNLTLVENAATDLAGVTTDGTLSVTSTGAITDSGTLSVTGAASFITKNNTGGTGTITLDDNGDATLTNSLGSVTLRTLDAAGTATVASAIVFKEGAATDLALVDTGSTLAVESTGAITDSGNLAVGGNASFNAGANAVTLGDGGTETTNFGSLTFTGGAVNVTEDSSMTLSGANTAASLTLAALGIDDGAGGTVTVTGATSLNAGAGNALTLDNNNNFDSDGSGDAVTVVNGDAVTLKDINNLVLGAVTATGALAVTVDADDNGANTLTLTGSLSGVVGAITLSGSATSNDTLVGPNTATTWTINAANGGTLAGASFLGGGASFANFANLTGGTADDTFTLAVAGSLSGTVDGGTSGTNTLSYAGGSAATVVITAQGTSVGFQGTASQTGGFNNITVLTGSGSTDSLTGDDVASTWDIDGTNTYTDGTRTLAFSAVENFTGGSGVDTFNISANHTGDMSGGAGGDVFNLRNGAVVTGNLSGGANNDTFDFNDGAELPAATRVSRVTGNVSGGGGTDTLDFSDSAHFTVTAITLDPDADGGKTGTIDDGDATPAESSDLIGGTFSGIDSLIGNNGALKGPDAPNAWVINGLNSGTLNGSPFTNFSVLGGSDTDTFTIVAGGAFDGSPTDVFHIGIRGGAGTDTLIGPNANSTWMLKQVGGTLDAGEGTINYIGKPVTTPGPDAIVFIDIENITGGTADDSFTLQSGGTLSGTISGGGGAGSDTLTGDNVVNTWTVTSAGGGTLTGTGGFTNMENLVGGTSADTFTLTGGSLSGSINGGLGFDTLSGDATALTVNITASNTGNVSTGVTVGSFLGIDMLVGSTAGDTFNFNANFTGDVDGEAGNDVFNFSTAGVTVSGSVGGGADGDTFNVSASVTVDLEGNAGNDTFTLSSGATLTGSIAGGFGNDAFDLAAGTTLNGDLFGGAGDDTYGAAANLAGTITGTVDTGFGDDTWNFANGVSLGSNLEGPDGSKLKVPANTPAGQDVIIGTDLVLPTMTDFFGHFIVGTAELDATPVVVNIKTLTVDADVISGGKVTLLAENIDLAADISAGGPGGERVVLVAKGSGTGDGDITALGPVTISGGSAALIAANAIENSAQILLDLNGGPLFVAVGGNAEEPVFDPSSNASGAELATETTITNLITRLNLSVQGVVVLFSNPGAALAALEQLVFLDIGLFEKELTLFGTIGSGIAMDLSQCEEAEGCAPSVSMDQLNELIAGLEARIAELERRRGAGEVDAATADRLIAGFQEQLAKFKQYQAELETYEKEQQEAEEIEDLEELGGEEELAPAEEGEEAAPAEEAAPTTEEAPAVPEEAAPEEAEEAAPTPAPAVEEPPAELEEELAPPEVEEPAPAVAPPAPEAAPPAEVPPTLEDDLLEELEEEEVVIDGQAAVRLPLIPAGVSSYQWFAPRRGQILWIGDIVMPRAHRQY